MSLKCGAMVFEPERFAHDVCTVRLSFGVQKCVCVRTARQEIVTSAASIGLQRLLRLVSSVTSI